MTKEEFLKTEEPLVMIVSLEPESGKVLYDTYAWDIADAWEEDLKNDFPDYLFFRYWNPAAIEKRKEIIFGITPKSCTTCKFSLVIEENDEVCGTCRDFSNYKSRL